MGSSIVTKYVFLMYFEIRRRYCCKERGGGCDSLCFKAEEKYSSRIKREFHEKGLDSNADRALLVDQNRKENKNSFIIITILRRHPIRCKLSKFFSFFSNIN